MNRSVLWQLLLALALLTPGWGGFQARLAAQPAPGPATTREAEAGAPSSSASGGADASAGQPAREPSATGAAGAAQPAPEDDPWGFEDEEEDVKKEETWLDVVRPQLFDLSLTFALLAVATVSFFLKSKPLKYIVLVCVVAYLGVVKSTMISVTDIFRIVESSRAVIEIPAGERSLSTVATAIASGFPTFRDSMAWYLFAGFTLVSTILFGRLYCGRICAFGAFTQLMDAVLPKRLRVDPPKWLEKRASYVKFGLLFATVAYYAATKQFTIYRYVEPFWMYTRSADVVLWTMLGGLLLATVVVRNLYCRFLCPVGAMLGLLSFGTVFGIKRWSECKSCKICEKTCEWGAIEGPKILKTECVRCDDCERVYADQSKCPHWLIPIIRQKKVAEALKAGRPAPQFIPIEKVGR